jgi:hypothetical protein
MTALALAIEDLISTHGDLDLIARSLQVNAIEIANALKTTAADSAEGVALRVLAKYNPEPISIERKKIE